jgi:hypothetical protein
MLKSMTLLRLKAAAVVLAFAGLGTTPLAVRVVSQTVGQSKIAENKPFGTRVKVLSDIQPSRLHPTRNPDGTSTMSELRDVRITVLDGTKAGITGDTARTGIRPASRF